MAYDVANSGWSLYGPTDSVAAPVMPTLPGSFAYTPGGAVDAAMVKYLQDLYNYGTQTGSGYGFTQTQGLNYADPHSPTGMWSVVPISNQQTSTSGNSNDGLGGFSGFGITQTGPWQSKQKAYIYGPDGTFQQEIEPSNPNARDYGELAAKLIVAIAGGGAAASAMSGAAAGAGGFGAEGGMAGGAVGAGGGGAAGSAIGTAAGSAGGVGTMPTLPMFGTEGLSTLPEFGAAGGTVGTLPSLQAFSTAGVPSSLPEFSASGLGGIGAGGIAKAGGGLASAAGAGGGGGSDGTVSKAALDGTNVFGANSAPDALNIDSLVNAAPGSESANAVAQIAKTLGYSDTQSFLNQLKSSTSGLLGPAASILGGAAGAAGTPGHSASETKQLPDYLKGPVVGDLIPRTQGLLASQMPMAQQYGAQMASQGKDLMNAPVAGNGFAGLQSSGNSNVNQFGKVQMADVGSMMNPYYEGMANDISRRTQDLLNQNNLAIQGNSVATGGLGGSRQGVAQGVAAGKAADYLQGNLASLGGNMYQSALSGALNKYGTDTSFSTAQRGQDLSNLGLMQNYYGQQRGQDLTQATIGSGMVNNGLQTQWSPLSSASSIYSPYSGFGTTTQSTPGQSGGWQGLLGGALAGAQLGSNLGWW